MNDEIISEMNNETLETIRLNKVNRMEHPGKLLIKGHLFLAYLNFKEQLIERQIRIANKNIELANKKLELAKVKHERKSLKKSK